MLSPPAIPVGFFARAEVCHGAGVSPTDHQESAPHPSATFRDNGFSTAQTDPFGAFGAAYQIENPAAPGLSRAMELMSRGVDTEKSWRSATLPCKSCPIYLICHC